MITNWFITGDTHGAEMLCRRLRFFRIQHSNLKPEETGIIILGDAGINYHGESLSGSYDAKDKEAVSKFGYQLYILRGNHEIRPSTLSTIKYGFDENVQGRVYYEEEYPNIYYFKDSGGTYTINGTEVFIIPGAYSVDKNFRLATGKNWFRDEQLTEEEKENLLIDLHAAYEAWWMDGGPTILSHSCPCSWEEHIKYLFLDNIDQTNIDKKTEIFLDRILINMPDYKYWYFGHFHDDRDFPDIRATILYKKIIPFGKTLEESL